MSDLIAPTTYRLPIQIKYALTTNVYSALRIQVELEALWNSSETFRAMVLDFKSTGSSTITITDDPVAFPGWSGIGTLGSAAASNWITGSHIYLSPTIYSMQDDGSPVSVGRQIVHELAHRTKEAYDARGYLDPTRDEENAVIAIEDRIFGAFGEPVYGTGGRPVNSPIASEFRAKYFIDRYLSQGHLAECFSAGTPILLADGTNIAIEDIRVGDRVAAFDECDAAGTAKLTSGLVTRLIPGITSEWIVLDDASSARLGQPTRVTPHHRYLRPDGTFMAIADIIAGDGLVVDADGTIASMRKGRLRFTRNIEWRRSRM